MVWLILVAVALPLLVVSFDGIARHRHWRLGRWSWYTAGRQAGGCRRCNTTFAYVPAHLTVYDVGQGVTPLCQPCWVELRTPEARWPFYIALFTEWQDVYARAGMEDELKRVTSVAYNTAAAVRTGQ